MTREDQVTADSPQNHIAIATSAENRLPARSPKAPIRIAITAGMELPLASVALSAPLMSLIESVRAISSKYPTTLETATDMTIPHGARRRGSTVSSDTLAEAS